MAKAPGAVGTKAPEAIGGGGGGGTAIHFAAGGAGAQVDFAGGSAEVDHFAAGAAGAEVDFAGGSAEVDSAGGSAAVDFAGPGGGGAGGTRIMPPPPSASLAFLVAGVPPFGLPSAFPIPSESEEGVSTLAEGGGVFGIAEVDSAFAFRGSPLVAGDQKLATDACVGHASIVAIASASTASMAASAAPSPMPSMGSSGRS